jgi:hypothetical protein
MFELATRKKFRFPYKGSITVEDLWDLDLVELDAVYKNLNKMLENYTDKTLLGNDNDSGVVKMLKQKINIVTYIFNTKEKEIADHAVALEKAKKKAKLLDILAKKQDENLEDLSEDEIKAMIEDLD